MVAYEPDDSLLSLLETLLGVWFYFPDPREIMRWQGGGGSYVAGGAQFWPEPPAN